MDGGPPMRGPPPGQMGGRGRDYDYTRGPPTDRPRRRSPSYSRYEPGGPPPGDRRPPSPPPFRARSPPFGYRPRSRSPPMRFGRSRSPPRRYRSPSPYRNGGRFPPPGGPDGPLPEHLGGGGPSYAEPYGARPGPFPPPRGISPARSVQQGSRFSPPPFAARPYDRGPPPPFGDRYDPYRARSPDRDRDWGRRGYRSPSPPPFRGDGYRGRSRSRSRERDFYGGRGRSMSPVRHGPPGGRRESQALQSPDEMENLLRFEGWSRWFWQAKPEIAKEEETNHPGAKPEDQPVVGLPKHYLKYKENFKARQLWSLYLVHKDQGWFKDRYSNERDFVNMRIENTKRGKAETVRKYIATLAEGHWDDINYEASRSSENKRLPNGLSVWGPGEPQGSDPDVIEIEHPPKQLFIKTVHSNHSRSSLEEAFKRVSGYQYLALSDPSPKKQYARVGWIQFGQNTNMDSALAALDKVKVGGFQLNMVKNGEPFIGRARYTPSLSCTLERMQHDCQQAKAMALKLESDLFLATSEDVDEDDEMKDDKPNQESLKEATANSQLAEAVSGRVEERIKMLWENNGLVKPEEQMSTAELHEKARIELDHWLSYLRNGLHTCYYCVAPTDYAEELYRKCIRHLRSPLAQDTEEIGADVAMEDVDEKTSRTNGRGAVKRKAHDRNTKADVWAEKRWSDNVDHKIKLVILPRDKIELEEYGAKERQDYPAYKRLIEANISVDDPKKSRCTICNKPFKSADFVARHIVSRHPELLQELPDLAEFEERVNKDYPMFNNFALDPQHLPPTLTYPASVEQRMPHLPAELLPTSREPGRRSDHYRSDDHGRGSIFNRLGGYAAGGPDAGPREPPAKIKEDPRARRGKISYVDLDALTVKAEPEPVEESGGLPW